MNRSMFAGVLLLGTVLSFGDVITIDFDHLPDQSILPQYSVLTEQYAEFGVHFSSTEDGIVVNSITSNTFGPDGNYWGNTTNSSTFPRNDVLTIDFDFAVSDVSMIVNPFGCYDIDVALNSYDAQGDLLETLYVGYDDPPSLWTPVAFTSDNISRIDVLQPIDDWYFGIDNLTFDNGAEAVPEPTTTAIMAFSVIMIGLIGVRRKKKPEQKS